MSLVVDASVVVAALVDAGADGQWAERTLLSGPLLAPHLMPAEATNVLRRAIGTGAVDETTAALAAVDLGDLDVTLVAFRPLAERIWELRANLTSYDAWYVALAEGAGCPLATLDRRLAQSPGVQCEVLIRD